MIQATVEAEESARTPDAVIVPSSLRRPAHIYALTLDHGKFYVGKSNDVERRFREHVAGTACEWTRTHRVRGQPIMLEAANDFNEDVWTKRYMKIYGIDNVRGGVYTQLELSEAQRVMLLSELQGADDRCFNCSKTGHFAKECPTRRVTSSPARRDVPVVSSAANENLAAMRSIQTLVTSLAQVAAAVSLAQRQQCDEADGSDSHSSACFECGALDHFVRECPVRRQRARSRSPIDDRHRQQCTRCGRSSHIASECYAKTRVHPEDDDSDEDLSRRVNRRVVYDYSDDLDDDGDLQVFCSRCGRESHTVEQCYASTTIDGDFLGRGRR